MGAQSPVVLLILLFSHRLQCMGYQAGASAADRDLCQEIKVLVVSNGLATWPDPGHAHGAVLSPHTCRQADRTAEHATNLAKGGWGTSDVVRTRPGPRACLAVQWPGPSARGPVSASVFASQLHRARS